MMAIFKKELKGYFTSPMGYVLLAIFTVISGIFFFIDNLSYGDASLTSLYNFIMVWLFMIMAPMLTMKLMSEEKKLKTDQLLLTSPVKVFGIVMGKFLSAFSFLLISLSVTLLYAIVTFMYGSTQFEVFLGNLLAAILVGAAFLAIGLFISSLTENQLIAAFGTFGVIILLMLLDTFAQSINNPTISAILNWLSVYSRFSDFALGVFDLTSIIYYLSVISLFLFLTARVIEKKRYS